MNAATRTTCAVLVCLSWTLPVWSDPILIDARRFVRVGGDIAFVGDEERQDFASVLEPDTPFGPWNASVSLAIPPDDRAQTTGTATQHSLVSPTHMAVSGGLDSLAVPGEGTGLSVAQSEADVTFDLTAPHRYAFHAAVQSARSESGSGNGEFSLGITSANSEPIGIGGIGEFAAAGILPAGRYEFILEAATSVETGPGVEPSHVTASYEGDLELTPVPEPDSVLLVATGSALFLRRRARSTA